MELAYQNPDVLINPSPKVIYFCLKKGNIFLLFYPIKSYQPLQRKPK